MDTISTGRLICSLRKKRGLTQKELGKRIGVSDKTVSKWERGLGCPDVSLLSPLSRELNTNIENVLGGELVKSPKIAGNLKKTMFFVCPDCLNVITALGNAHINCCGNELKPLIAGKADSEHEIITENVEDELFVYTRHPMEKDHYISFFALLEGGRITFSKLYPEGNAEARFKKVRRAIIVFYCTEHGLMYSEI